MNMPIAVTPAQFAITKSILKKYFSSETEIWIFGSRAHGKPKRFSDLDIAINAHKSISLSIFAALKNDFDESDLPFKVDIVDWNTITASFQEIIANQRIRVDFL